MKKILFTVAIVAMLACEAMAQTMIYQQADSVKVMELLTNAPKKNSMNEYMIYFGSALTGIPYVAQTLEVGKKENLIINLRELDCTTFTENVLALSLCAANDKKTFLDFGNYIRLIRYKNGHIAYPTRLHYFTSWIEENTKNGFVEETSAQVAPFTAIQTLNIDFMSKHASLYPALVRDTTFVEEISKTEKELTGKRYRYIPKAQLRNHQLLKKYIKTGDIIVILTKKAGLDTSHIGIASWHKDGTLHLLNASQIHKKVIDEPMTLYTYMQKHPSQIGIRVVKPL